MTDTENEKKCRQLKIKTGVVKRLTKDVLSYELEVTQQQARIDKLKATSDDEHLIKKQIEVLEESQKIIPDCIRRLKIAFEELQDLMDSEKELSDKAEYKAGQEALVEALPVMNH